MDETKTTAAALAAAREQVRHTLERLDEIRADLEATAAGLRLPEHGMTSTDPSPASASWMRCSAVTCTIT